MSQFNGLTDAVLNQLSSVANSDVVAGTPIQLAGATVVPISRVSMGIGAGDGEGESSSKKKKRKGRKAGRGTGGAGKIRPVAVVVLNSDGIDVLRVDVKKGKLDRLLDKLPELIEKAQDK